jgi:hypothetical protein
VKDWLTFLAALAEPLYELFVYTRSVTQKQDPEVEKQLAMRIIRKASDERMRRELGQLDEP